jgi:multiple sugar transport system substrate-binding protein
LLLGLARFAFLPTQVPIGQGPYSKPLNQTIPYYNEFISMIPFGRGRPNIPEYPHIAKDIRQAINEVQIGTKEPKQALDDAAARSANAVGW